MSPSIKIGDTLPSTKFTYVPPSSPTDHNDDILSCGLPITYKTDEHFPNRSILIVAVPGAFTPTCTEQHIPQFLEIQNIHKIFSKGIDEILIISSNDAFVLNAWGKALTKEVTLKSEIKNRLLFLSDPNAEWCKKLGLSQDGTARGMGIRTKRFAMIVKDSVVSYLGVESGREVGVSGAEAVISKL